MSTSAQIEANRENAQSSTGPKTDEGKAASSQNNHRHGLAGGVFQVLPWEDQDKYKDLLLSLLVQHQPQTAFEEMLVQKIAQHFWLSQRAVELQQFCFELDLPLSKDDPGLKLYLRYQTTHDRAFHKLSDELRKLRNEKRKEQRDEAAHLSEPKIQAIGFESQKAKQAAETRRAAAESRRQNEEIRRAAAATRSEVSESRKSELHSKRLALLDAQIARLEPPVQSIQRAAAGAAPNPNFAKTA